MAEVRIDVNIEGLRDAENEIDRVERALEPPSITESMGTGADILVSSIKQFVPVESGALQGTIDKREVSPFEYSIGPKGSLRYANIQNEGGTNVGHPFMILPGGRPVREITIRGSEYMTKGFEAGKEEAVAAVKAAVEAKIGL
jgi:hypothetical protein